MASHVVLFVTRDGQTRARLEPLLRAAGLAAMNVGSAAEAREALKMVFFPVAIIEQALDDAAGVDLCREIRRCEKASPAYVLLVSQRNSANDVAKGTRRRRRRLPEHELVGHRAVGATEPNPP